MPRWDRERRAGRNPEPIEPRRRLLVVSEGEVTERQYLLSFVNWCKNPRVTLDFEGPAGDPRTLVQRAKELRDEADALAKRLDPNLAYDEIWCVFDRDEHPHVESARDMAHANGLSLAMTDPCFELWLLLHLRDSPGPQHRHKVQDMLAGLMPKVSRKHVDFEALRPGYEEAVRRAKRLLLDAAESGNPNGNPSTEVHLLTDSIDEERRARHNATTERSDDTSRRKRAEAEERAYEQYQAELRSAEDALTEPETSEREVGDEPTQD